LLNLTEARSCEQLALDALDVLVGVVQIRLMLYRTDQETKGRLREAARIKNNESKSEHLAKRNEAIKFLCGSFCRHYQIALVRKEPMGARLAKPDEQARRIDLDLC
jgi:hypothetical protein